LAEVIRELGKLGKLGKIVSEHYIYRFGGI
jgi:hypothetical protein